MGKPEIAILGSRGIPARYGGFETFAEVLAEKLTEFGHEVIVYSLPEFRSIPLTNSKIKRVFIYTPRLSSLEKVFMVNFSILHCVLGRRSEVMIFLGVSGGLMMWLPSLLRIRTIVNIDGLEWKRSRWGNIIQFALKMLEQLVIKWADVVIVDSEAVGEYVLSKYKRNYVFIPYGVDACSYQLEDWTQIKGKYRLEQNGYYLIVGRHVPENNFDISIRGFLQSNSHKKLVIVSNLKKGEKYFCSDRVIFTGPIYDRPKLYALRANAYAYIHGHSVGGTNPSLLEAISSKNIIFAYDVPYNYEVLKEYGFYFKNEKDLAQLIQSFENGQIRIDREEIHIYYEKIIREKYNWDIVLKKYDALLY